MTDTETAPETFVLDIATLTLGEMSAVELASGKSFDKLLMAGSASRRLVGLYIRELRAPRSPSDEPMPSWSDLAGRRLTDL
jgi:hypothetical protein